MKTFTKKVLGAAIAGSSLMIAASAGAVNVNHDGIGEVLIYPYYTVRNNQTTLISVVNTTNRAKAVKVRFNEGKNSQEVLDFNLWLSARDVWTGAIVANATGASITTADKSCTNPRIPAGGEPFRGARYSTDNSTLTSLDRTREGYIEIIEMAEVDANTPTEDDVTHNASGVPDCTLVTNAKVAANLIDYSPATGGLFGAGTIVGNNMSTGYNATAIEGFGYRSLVQPSGDVLPDLNSGTSVTAVVVDSPASGVSRITNAVFAAGRSIDAVSAVIMHSSVLGEYAYDATFGTDWVITMPTKRFYVNGATPVAPFQRIWNGRTATGNGTACVDVTIASYDREEQTSERPDDFSPSDAAGIPQLCWESTVVSFGQPTTAGTSGVLASKNVAFFNAYQNPAAAGGWAELVFGNGASTPAPYVPVLAATAASQQTSVSGAVISAPVTGAVTFAGLPAIGFSMAAASFANATSNFNSSYSLNFRRSISGGN